MRILMGMIWQETNTFSPLRTTLKDFEDFGLYYGDEIIKRYAETTELGGFIQAAQTEKDVELIPIIRAQAWSNGKIERSAYDFLRDRVLEKIEEVEEFDGILLALHGAWAAEGVDDATGKLLDAVRRRIRQDCPIGISLDFHANITKLMVQSVHVLVGYHTCPHIDMLETGYRVAKILFSIVRGEIHPTIGWKKLPMITPAEKHNTFQGPLAEIFNQVKTIENMETVISASIFPVQPWLDVQELGWSAVAITDSNPELAQELAEQLADLCWNQRKRFLVKKISLEKALDKALSIDGGPIILSDAADSTGSGAPGDSTFILQALMSRDMGGKSLLTIVDPEAVEKAIATGIGRKVTIEVGGKRDNIYSKPVRVTGTVRRITDGRFVIKGPMTKNL